MIQSFILGAYWTGRKETSGECADRVRAFLAEISEIDESFTTWYQRSGSRKDATSNRVDTRNRNSICEMMERGRHQRDIGGDAIESLGFRIGLWNGATKEENTSSISILCGSFNEIALNSVTLALPSSLVARSSVEKVQKLLSVSCSVWRPGWAGVMSKESMKLRDFSARKPFVDWMVFTPRTVGAVPPPAVATPVASGGTLIVTQPQPPCTDDEKVLARIRAIESLVTA